MDNQSRLRFARMHRLKNPVKWNNDKLDLVRRQLQPQLQRQKSARHRPGHGDFCPRQIDPAQRLFGHDHRPIAVPHARPARQQRILRTDISVSVDADRRDIQFPPRGPLIQSLDVLQYVLELEAVRRNQILGQPVEHKCVIRIRRMSQR